MSRRTKKAKSMSAVAAAEYTAVPAIGPDLTCPKCGATEIKNPKAPTRDWIWQIRPNKVQTDDGAWWSQCLICRGNNPDKGWFCSY